MEFHKDDTEIDWKKENGGREKPFDFDEFLDSEGDELDDRVTKLLGGKELLEPDAFGGDTEFVPGRRGDGEHGRHEIPVPESTALEGGDDESYDAEPEPESEEPQDPSEEEPYLDPNDPRYAAPERPRIIVAEPRPKVYIDPTPEEEPDEGRGRRGMSEAGKWIVAALVVIAIIGGAMILFLRGPVSVDSLIAAIMPRTETTERRQEAPAARTPSPAANTPAPTPEVTPGVQTETHTITVTAGDGGSISPSGAVKVRDGESVTFSIVPSNGYALSQLLVDGSAAEMGGTYTFQDVTKDHTIYAAFQWVEPAPTPEELPVLTPDVEVLTPEPIPEVTPEPLPEITPEPLPEQPVEQLPEPISELPEPEPLPEELPTVPEE